MEDVQTSIPCASDVSSPTPLIVSPSRDKIEGLEDKAELLRSEYYTQIEKYERRVNLLKGFTLFGSVAIALLAFMDQSYLGAIGLFTIAGIGIVLAVIAFIDPIYSQSEQLSSYRRAVRECTRFIRECHAHSKDKKKGLVDVNTANQTEDRLLLKYENIIEYSPDSRLGTIGFLQHKRIHEMKVRISQMISNDPFNNEIDVKMSELDSEMKKAGL